MDGVLLRILRRLRGLHSVNLNFYGDWQDHVRDWSGRNHLKWEKENARDFLLLIKEELSHIKKITIDWTCSFEFGDPATICWMTDELEKRNKAWAPPLPSYKNFRSTLSPVSIVDARVARSVVEFNDEYRIRGRKYGLDDSESLHGVSDELFRNRPTFTSLLWVLCFESFCISMEMERVLSHDGELTPGKADDS